MSIFEISEKGNIEPVEDLIFFPPQSVFSEINRKVNARVRKTINSLKKIHQLDYEAISANLSSRGIEHRVYCDTLDFNKCSVKTASFFRKIQSQFNYSQNIRLLKGISNSEFTLQIIKRGFLTERIRFTYIKESSKDSLGGVLRVRFFFPKTRDQIKQKIISHKGKVYLNEFYFKRNFSSYIYRKEAGKINNYVSVDEILDAIKNIEIREVSEIRKRGVLEIPFNLLHFFYDDLVFQLDVKVVYEPISLL
jgi:hypothetical protein